MGASASTSFLPDAERMEIGERLEPVQDLLDWPPCRRAARRAPRRDAPLHRLAPNRNARIPIAPASESRFRTIEFLQRPERRQSYLPVFRIGRRRNLNNVRCSTLDPRTSKHSHMAFCFRGYVLAQFFCPQEEHHRERIGGSNKQPLRCAHFLR